MRADAFTSASPERTISAAISSEASGSARSKPVSRITTAAIAVAMNA